MTACLTPVRWHLQKHLPGDTDQLLLRRLLVALGRLRQKWTKEQVLVGVVVERDAVDAAQEVAETAQVVNTQHHLQTHAHTSGEHAASPADTRTHAMKERSINGRLDVARRYCCQQGTIHCFNNFCHSNITLQYVSRT